MNPSPNAERELPTMREGLHMLRLALVQAECAIKGREHTGFINKVLNATSHLMDPLHVDRASARRAPMGSAEPARCHACNGILGQSCYCSPRAPASPNTGAAVRPFVMEVPDGKAEEALSPDEYELYATMSEISEDRWFAGWLSGNEFAIWSALQDGELMGMDRELVAHAAAISVKTGKWIVWRSDDDLPLDEHGPHAIPLIDWLMIYDAKNDPRATPSPSKGGEAVKPWQERMEEHYAKGSAQCLPTGHFMAAELDDWRAGAVDGPGQAPAAGVQPNSMAVAGNPP